MEDLIVKISDKCNFKCDFCSSNNIALTHNDLDIEVLKEYLRNNKVMDLIVNGGDPLMTEPVYYEELLNFIDKECPDTTVSLTTNLYEFWKHPYKWTPILKRVGVCTSFQYGDERKLADGTVFTEDMFIKIFNLFEERIGYKLQFIAVINERNEDTVLDTVKLAKRLGTICKVNACLRSGRSLFEYPYYEMFSRYLDIIEAGLGDYEANCQLIKDAWHGKLGICPYNPDCGDTIKCMSPNGQVTRCGSISDDIMLPGFMPEYFLMKTDKPDLHNRVISVECYGCEFFDICNSCYKRVMDIKDADFSDIAEHCLSMRDMLDRTKKLLGEKE